MLIRTLAFLLVFSPLASLTAYPGCWDEKDPVQVTLIVVLASEEGNTVEKGLNALADEVRKLHPHLKSFTRKSVENRSLKPNEKASMLCVEDKHVEMTIVHGADKDNRVELSVKPPCMNGLDYQSVCGKFLPIVTPCKTKKGETVVLLIRVEPCRGKSK